MTRPVQTVVVGASRIGDSEASLYVWCEVCDSRIVEWRAVMDCEEALSTVVTAASAHDCEEPA